MKVYTELYQNSLLFKFHSDKNKGRDKLVLKQQTSVNISENYKLWDVYNDMWIDSIKYILS